MYRYTFILSILCFLILILSSCRDAEINPYEDDTGIYSIYGAIDLHGPEHVIRVRDLNVFHQDSNSINLDATVTFFDLEQGTSQVLRDSIVLFPENYTHNFMLNKEFAPRSPYRVVVERSDGESVSSDFTMPGITKTYVFPILENEEFPYNCSREIEITFRNVIPSEQIRWEIGFKYGKETYWRELTNLCKQSYDPERNDLVIMVNTLNLLNTVFPKPMNNASCNDVFPAVTCGDLDSGEVMIRYLHLGPEWNRIFPERPSDPLDVGDVVNGLGFLGGFRQDTLSFFVIPD